MTIPSNLPQRGSIQGWWGFEDDFTDGSGNGNTLSEVSGTIAFNASGKIDKAADFEYSETEYLNIADASQTGLDIESDLTVAGWFKWEDIGTIRAHLIGKWHTTNDKRSWALWKHETNHRAWVRLSANGTAETSVYSANDVFANGTWVHVGFTYKESTDVVQVYVNGATSGDAGSHDGGLFDASTQGFTIGGNGEADRYMDGLIDEVIVWNTTLTATEMLQVKNITAYRYVEGGFSGVNSSFWNFIEAWEKHDKLWKPRGILVPEGI